MMMAVAGESFLDALPTPVGCGFIFANIWQQNMQVSMMRYFEFKAC